MCITFRSRRLIEAGHKIATVKQSINTFYLIRYFDVSPTHSTASKRSCLTVGGELKRRNKISVVCSSFLAVLFLLLLFPPAVLTNSCLQSSINFGVKHIISDKFFTIKVPCYVVIYRLLLGNVGFSPEVT